MPKKILFGLVAALLIAVGLFAIPVSSGNAAIGMSSGAQMTPPNFTPAPDLQKVAINCGWWNNWCNNGCGAWNNWCHSGGSVACIMFGGIQLCTGGGGGNCHWSNGVQYCQVNNDCIRIHKRNYCTWKHHGDCFWKNGRQYCSKK